tara:strand:+ start:3090 stop:3416 length:327 start_codon:yes stop_codon:yes gene_type:complete
MAHTLTTTMDNLLNKSTDYAQESEFSEKGLLTIQLKPDELKEIQTEIANLRVLKDEHVCTEDKVEGLLEEIADLKYSIYWAEVCATKMEELLKEEIADLKAKLAQAQG